MLSQVWRICVKFGKGKPLLTIMKEMAYGKDFGGEDKNEKATASLEKLIATPKKNKFGARTLEEFEMNLDIMNTDAMQRLCVKVGETPSGSRMFLKKKLRLAFKKHTAPKRVIQGGSPRK